MKPMRVGLLGGTFNPPHFGHLKLAEIALEELGLDQVRFIPTASPPHKPVPPGDPDGAARIRLLGTALAANTWSQFTIPLATLNVVSWEPAQCPLCAQGLPVVKPGSRPA